MGNLNSIFKIISEIEPSIGLENRILEKIALRNKLAMRRKLAFIHAGFVASTGIFVWAIFTLGKAIHQSTFWDLATLLFSDTELIIRNWSSFTYSLLETLPIFGIIAILFPIFALFILASTYFKTVSNNRYKFI